MADNKKLTKQDLTGSNKTSRRKWLLTALAAAAIAAGGAWYGGVFAPDAAPAYRTADITRGNLMVTVTANGTVNPVRTVSIGSELSGIVRNVLVDVNSVVKKGDVLCIVEAMKLMNEIQAERDGEIVDICAHDGDVVEFGQTLFKLYER